MKILFYCLVIGTILLSALAIGHWRKSGPVIGFQIPLTDAEVPASSIQIASGNPNLGKQNVTYLLVDFSCRYSRALMREVRQLDGELPQNCQIYLVNNPILDGSEAAAEKFVEASMEGSLKDHQGLIRRFDGHPEDFANVKVGDRARQIVREQKVFASKYAKSRSPVILQRYPDGHYEEIPSIQHLRILFRQIVAQDGRLAPACCTNPLLQ